MGAEGQEVCVDLWGRRGEEVHYCVFNGYKRVRKRMRPKTPGNTGTTRMGLKNRDGRDPPPTFRVFSRVGAGQGFHTHCSLYSRRKNGGVGQGNPHESDHGKK